MTENVSIIATTLIINGFKLNLISRPDKDSCIFVAHKRDILGASLPYAILVTNQALTDGQTKTLITVAEGQGATPLIVTNNGHSDLIKTLRISEFEKLLGGFIDTGLVTLPGIAAIMDELGHNKVPTGLIGDADVLLEIYTKECLRYLLCAPGRRFGSERSFEKLPDGIILGGSTCNLMFDAKAYKSGFEFKADDIRRFSSYIEDFNDRYKNFYKFKYFIVVSGHFNDSDDSIKGRSDELFNECGARICCIPACELGALSQLFISRPLQRNAIKWENVFVKHRISSKDLQDELSRLDKDKLL
ncbi:hypothetical protein [Pseudoflavitalea rhizosphaerae]|uniref:hypothetical protein n=1 Tax=Pseudoflavitalea rhizosphaerae TaxID=1884793 RepID=UPI000F8EC7C4|nr:hypothetical protein [Pseudoflavitalea rhizosphaerae]